VLPKIIATFLAPTLTVAPSMVAQDVPASTFVFLNGDPIVIDGINRMARYGPFDGQVRGCSTASVACLDVGFLRISVPKACGPFEAGQVVGVGQDAVTIVGWLESDGFDERVGQHVYLVAQPGRRDVLIGYVPLRGVAFIMQNVTMHEDLLAGALAAQRAGQLRQWLRDHARRVFGLITFQRLFRCGA
jgi:hypothetical protein